VCSLCNGVNMFINTTNPSYPCVLCSPTHCLNCLTINQCSVCDAANGYFLNPADQQCYLCTSTVVNCQTCSSYLKCQTCIAPYYINSTDTTSTGQCVSCPINGCLVCISGTQCQTCNTALSYILLPNSLCQYCDNSLNIFINSTLNNCQLCTIPYCIQCSSLISCSICNTS
jgi:hypothetical protein